ncbi:MAG TPA: tRNA (adenosine(37)-N6)-dimethylallyltransferase MiaA, partial [Bacteroidetes bacterium]|nr:tRNA (adenosine(37)-N6)-dimethylallyltransferase MiaA [Bacteroidota bacterium]
KEELNELFEKEGIGVLQQELREKDPAYFAEADTQNPMRLLRALAVCRATGQPFSSFRKKSLSGFHIGEKTLRPFVPIYILLEWERPELYKRINLRVDKMMEAGLLEEAKALFPYRHLNALQTVGYQELFAHLAGKMDLGEAVEKIKQNSRRYAKRQMTWFRKEGHWERFAISQTAQIIEYLEGKMAPVQKCP